MSSTTFKGKPPAHILAIDVGGLGIKAAVINIQGEIVTERLRVHTPPLPLKPHTLVDAIVELVKPFRGKYDTVSVGFPGVVRNGKIVTAPNLGTETLKNLNLAQALQLRLGKPVRIANDADVQGLGAVEGKGMEMVITLGTGFGTALFTDGKLSPHLEFSRHPIYNGENYDQWLGDAALEKIGVKEWNRRLKFALEVLRAVTNFDHLYIGGGNAEKIDFKLPKDISIVSNDYGIRGGARLWYEHLISHTKVPSQKDSKKKRESVVADTHKILSRGKASAKRSK